MFGSADTTVVRLGHRPGRDERTTTHVALVARAFGADHAIIPETASQAVETVDDITQRFGGPFEVTAVGNPIRWLREQEGTIVHLTMYGEPVQTVVEDIHHAPTSEPLLVAVGAGKVPAELYELADWNVAVTNQPHSEIAALAVFLDRLSDGRALETTFTDGDVTVIPSERGKQVEPTTEE